MKDISELDVMQEYQKFFTMNATERAQLSDAVRKLLDVRSVNVRCVMCQQVHTLNVRAEDVDAWKNGKHAQDAFPYLNAGDRELLISRTCPKCWAEMFGEEPGLADPMDELDDATAARDDTPRFADTPWGPAQHVERLADGIYLISTAGHGGIWLSMPRIEQLHEAVGDYKTWLDRESGRGGWFEEDCDMLLPLVVFAADLPDKHREAVEKNRDACIAAMPDYMQPNVDRLK